MIEFVFATECPKSRMGMKSTLLENLLWPADKEGPPMKKRPMNSFNRLQIAHMAHNK
jgi:hypothetical protein